MEVNQLPKTNMDRSETGCCPRFEHGPWDNQEIVFDQKPFVKANTINILHMPLNMGQVIAKTWKKIEEAGAGSEKEFLLLSADPSPWKGEHYFLTTKEVTGANNVRLSGTFLTKVFEGDFKEAGKWAKEVEEHIRSRGKELKKLYFYYTTCPKCAKHYGKNFVVAFAQI